MEGIARDKEMEKEMLKRTVKFGAKAVAFSANLPSGSQARKLLECGVSIGLRYRSACNCVSGREWAERMLEVEKYSNQAQYLMELMADSGIVKRKDVEDMIKEAGSFAAISSNAVRQSRMKQCNRNERVN
jgi:hypothetical protein